MRGERGPASIYCDLCRDEVKREQNALRAQAYRQRKASYGGVVRSTHPPRPGRGFRRDTQTRPHTSPSRPRSILEQFVRALAQRLG